MIANFASFGDTKEAEQQTCSEDGVLPLLTSKSSSSTQTEGSNGTGDTVHSNFHEEQGLMISDKICNIQMSLENLLIAIFAQLQVQLQPVDNEPVSEKEAKRREIRVAEFKARFRRNYIYPLQIEIDRSIQQLNYDASDSGIEILHVAALRSLEKAHVHTFKALQAFHQQAIILRELLSDHVLLDNMFVQLIRMNEVSIALGLQNDGLTSQFFKFRTYLADESLNDQMGDLIIVKPPAEKKVSKPVPELMRRMNSKPQKQDRRPKEKVLRPQSRSRRPEEKVSRSPSTSGDRRPKEKSSRSRQPPVNLKVVVMQHMGVTQSNSEQQVSVPSNPEPSVPETVAPVTTMTGRDNPKSNQVSLEMQLQKAVLERLADENHQDLNQLIEQLVREEFL